MSLLLPTSPAARAARRRSPFLAAASLALLAVAAGICFAEDPFAGLENAGEGAPKATDTVRPGDTLEAIARRWYTGYVTDVSDGVRALRKKNEVDPRKLRAGQTLTVPFPFEGKPRTYVAPGSVQLDSVSAAYYGYADRPAAWWPLLYETNRAKLMPGGRLVRKGMTLEVPPLPTDRGERQKLALDQLDRVMTEFRRHLEGGDLTAAAIDRFLLVQGILPLVKREVPGHGADWEKTTALEVERLWQVNGAAAAVDSYDKKLSGQPQADPGEVVTQVTALSKQLETAAPAANSDPSLGARLDAARQKLRGLVSAKFSPLVREIPKLLSMPATAIQTAARAREARYEAWQVRYHLSRLSSVPAVAQPARDLQGELGVALISVPPPPPDLPALTQRVVRKDPQMKSSVSIAHKKYGDVWFPLAAAYARRLWTDFPAARDQWGRPIAPEDVLRAIVMHESRGVHMEAGRITMNKNSESSIDYGFGQINGLAHDGTSIKIADLARVIDDARWTIAKIGAVLEVPARDRDKKVVLDFKKPAHNLIATVLVLSYSINIKYPNTATPEEQLVKSLSGYNHGANNPDYRKPWLDLVRDVDPKESADALVSAVAYGIGMKLYLGIALDAPEVDWWQKLRRTSLQSTFYMFADPYQAYAHWK